MNGNEVRIKRWECGEGMGMLRIIEFALVTYNAILLIATTRSRPFINKQGTDLDGCEKER